jgi:hypothetical protein
MSELVASQQLTYDKIKKIVYGDNRVQSTKLTTSKEDPIVRIACAGSKMCVIECLVTPNDSEYCEIENYYEKQRFIEQLLHELKLYYSSKNNKVGKQEAKKLDISLSDLYNKIENREEFDDLLLENIANFLSIGVAVYDVEKDKLVFKKKSKIYRKRYINIGKTKSRYELLGIDSSTQQKDIDTDPIVTATKKPIHML